MIEQLWTSKKSQLQVILSFQDDTFLSAVKIIEPESWTDVAFQYLGKIIIGNMRRLDASFVIEASEYFKIETLAQDLSFTVFWTAYANKVGKKERSQELWKRLEDEEKKRALAYIKKYNNWLNVNQTITKLYPETYLSQKRWTNDD